MKLSVIICAYNRELFLAKAVESLVQQDADKNEYEIIVIDNNSKDNSPAIVKALIEKHNDTNILYFLETKQGLSFARNRGIAEARGIYISFIDDDGMAAPDYVRNMLKAFEKYPGFDALGGKILPVYHQGSEPVWMSRYIDGIVSKVDWGNEFGPFVKHKFPFGCNMAFRRNLFDEVCYFNTDLARSDDKFMFLTLREHGRHILYAPDIVVYHNIEATRTTREFVKKVSQHIGKNERVRLKDEPFATRIKKPFEYYFKFAAAMMLAIGFLFSGKPSKGSYVILVRWWVMTGYYS